MNKAERVKHKTRIAKAKAEMAKKKEMNSLEKKFRVKTRF